MGSFNGTVLIGQFRTRSSDGVADVLKERMSGRVSVELAIDPGQEQHACPYKTGPGCIIRREIWKAFEIRVVPCN